MGPRRIDRRFLLALVPTLALVVLLVLSSRTSPGAPPLPEPSTAKSALSTASGDAPAAAAVGAALSVPTRVPADAPVVTAPRSGNETPEELAAADRAATIRAYRGQRQPWETTVPLSAVALPGVPASGATAALSASGRVAGSGDTGSEEVGGGWPTGPFAILVGCVLAICGVAGRAFRRPPQVQPIEVLVP